MRYGDFPRASGGGLQFREFHDVEIDKATFGAGVLGPTLQEEGALRAGLEDLLSRLDAVPSEASLVVPDSWLRLTFADIDDLPRSGKEREEVLRWRLKSLVPFKVDELRLRAVELAPSGEETTRTVLLAFGAESLLRSLEASFSSYGIRLGRISNVSLSLLEAVWEGSGQEGVIAVVSVEEDSYTIAFADSGRPVLYRHKPLTGNAQASSLGDAVRRELRLTRTFITRHVEEIADLRIYLFSPPEEEERWRDWLSEELISGELAQGEIRTGSEFVPAGGRPAAVPAARVAPMMGAACALVS